MVHYGGVHNEVATTYRPIQKKVSGTLGWLRVLQKTEVFSHAGQSQVPKGFPLEESKSGQVSKSMKSRDHYCSGIQDGEGYGKGRCKVALLKT